MTGRNQNGGTRGPAAALFVLFGLLLNVATASGALDRDPRAARLGSGEIVRTTTGARLASRTDEDGSDHDEIVGAIPPTPQIVALASVMHPAGLSSERSVALRPLDPSFAYRARAPPAA